MPLEAITELSFTKSHLGKAARQAAVRLGLSVIGTLGILLAAKNGGLVDAIEPLMQALKHQGFWLSASLETSVLRSAGEATARGE